MELSKAERVLLWMLAEIQEALDISRDVKPSTVKQALLTGNHWALDWEYSFITEGESVPDAVLSETVDILDMWSILESSWSQLSEAEQQGVLDRDAVYRSPRFAGFDGNNEAHHNVATFLVEELGRFSEFRDRDLNSHMQSVPQYQDMLRVFAPIRRELRNRLLNAEEITQILRAPYRD